MAKDDGTNVDLQRSLYPSGIYFYVIFFYNYFYIIFLLFLVLLLLRVYIAILVQFTFSFVTFVKRSNIHVFIMQFPDRQNGQ